MSENGERVGEPVQSPTDSVARARSTDGCPLRDWPCTIVDDRYSRGWVAWPFEYAEVPRAPHSGDSEMMDFWHQDWIPCGVGATPQAALDALRLIRAAEGFEDRARLWRDEQENYERREHLW